jgi:hypothetical protein
MTSTKLHRALAVRDAVLPWLRQHGTLEAVGPKDGKPGAAIHATIGGFDIWYQKPFKGLPHGLQIPGCMILEWADDGRADFSFRAAKWDAALLRELDKEGVSL